MDSNTFSHARFQLAATKRSQWPGASRAEVAFAGRSNVGKSSAINAITGQQSLSRTSKTPGRTQQIVFFELPEGRYLVDLPGYGYAKAPVSLRQEWEKFITDYLFNRASLKVLCIPMDIRRPLTPLDQNMLDFCQDIELPAHILLTKADKFKPGKAKSLYRQVSRQLAEQPMVSVQLFSAKTGTGVQEAKLTLRDFLIENSR
ncbi:MAG: ribosome biogenesis GTP-binding protein YihA/YsxC [Gammaproteobacteria bacterium]|nr:ribosome biogenesis GTP-binding protein YihA/YsxC [Gammaproteobacteria bacterium]MCY4229247.1 ribosome biogenesis GTP-binding protein YihA/YsxC [Gammaproteobacteria bacterium]